MVSPARDQPLLFASELGCKFIANVDSSGFGRANRRFKLHNAVSFSSARTTKRFPSSRCASAMKIVRPVASTVATQPQLQPALLRLSAMIPERLQGRGRCNRRTYARSLFYRKHSHKEGKQSGPKNAVDAANILMADKKVRTVPRLCGSGGCSKGRSSSRCCRR
jgi:hypothetical protein